MEILDFGWSSTGPGDRFLWLDSTGRNRLRYSFRSISRTIITLDFKMNTAAYKHFFMKI